MGPKQLSDWAVVIDDITNRKAIVGLVNDNWVRIKSLKSISGRTLVDSAGETYELVGPPYRQDNFDSMLKDMVE